MILVGAVAVAVAVDNLRAAPPVCVESLAIDGTGIIEHTLDTAGARLPFPRGSGLGFACRRGFLRHRLRLCCSSLFRWHCCFRCVLQMIGKVLVGGWFAGVVREAD